MFQVFYSQPLSIHKQTIQGNSCLQHMDSSHKLDYSELNPKWERQMVQSDYSIKVTKN